jgi:hypothetical protein
MLRNSRGQATVEMLGALAALVAAGFAVWQLIVVGHSAWLAADAARVAARAQLVGEDPARAARSALPDALERGLRVDRVGAGGARVRVPVPAAHPAWSGRVGISATASLEAVP